MGKVLFILNPIAGGGKAEKITPTIEDVMSIKEIEYDIEFTDKPNEATSLAKDASKKGYTTVVAVGGDGTVNEVAKGLIDSNISFGIVPGGTGNDFARTLNMPLDPKEALINIIEGEKKSLDVGYVNGRLFLNIASIGMDAAVVQGAEKYKKKHQSGTAYLISLFETALKFKKKKMRFIIDGKSIEEDIYLVAVGNGKTYGGGLEILPMAKVDDGQFYICVVKKAIKPVLLFLLPSILSGKHIKYKKYVSIYTGKEVIVETDEDDIYLNVDGEIYGLENRTEFKIESNKLDIIY